MAAQNMPGPEFDVTVELVCALLADQHPDLAGRRVRRITHGWDNVILRVGDDLLARMPRRAAAGPLTEYEQRWLPELARRLPIEIPVPVRVGRPALGYPWHWSLCRWIDGDLAADVSLDDPAAEARRLGEFIRSLHVPAPDDAPDNPFRGQPVTSLLPRIEHNLGALGEMIDAAAVRSALTRLADTPDWVAPPVWLHGDLHSANVLVDEGRIAAVIDWGDITSGDPAVDLAIAWMLFDAAGREELRVAAGPVDDATWRRGELWALHFALVYLMNSADNPRFRRMGSSLLATVTA